MTFIVCSVDSVDLKIASAHDLLWTIFWVRRNESLWKQLLLDTKCLRTPWFWERKTYTKRTKPSETAMWLAKVHPDILGADSSDLQSIVTEARCGCWSTYKYLVLWMNCFLWPHAFFPGLHHAERSREKRRIRRDLSIVLPLARDWSPRLVCNFQDHFAQVHALVRMRNFAKPNQACRRAIGLRTSFVAGRTCFCTFHWVVSVASFRILQRLHTIVSSCFVGQDAPQFAMGVFVDAPELQLQSQAELERCFILTQRFQTFSAKETKCEQCYRPGAQRQSIFFVRASREWQTSTEAMSVWSWFLGAWTLHPLHLRSMTIQLEKAFDMTRHAALNTSFVGLEQNDRMTWPEVEKERESGNLPTGLF